MSQFPDTRALRVHAVRWEADTVLSYELRSPDGAPLPPFEAGAHLDLHLPAGLVRSYSLCNDPAESHRYVVGINRDAQSRGGSSWIHDNLHAGHMLQVSAPSNNFPLVEDAETSVLVAGGIGITPVLSMVRRLAALGRDWRLHLAVRTRSQAAFLEEIGTLAGDRPDRVRLHVDDENDGHVLDLASVVAELPSDAHVYCCGPLPMLEAFEKATSDLDPARSHVEYFSARDAAATEGGYVVELVQSGTTLTVQEGATILDTLLKAGIDVPYSCTEGICGTCETRVVSGAPDHRDMVLSDQEKEDGDVMMICCSGSIGDRLVLDR